MEKEKLYRIMDKIKYCEGCFIDGGICECGDEKFVVDIKELKSLLEKEDSNY